MNITRLVALVLFIVAAVAAWLASVTVNHVLAIVAAGLAALAAEGVRRP